MKKMILGLSLVTSALALANPSHLSKEQSATRLRPISDTDSDKGIDLRARMGDTESSSGYRQLFIYTDEKLSRVQFKVGNAENWVNFSEFSSPELKAYGTKSFLPAAPNQRFTVRGVRSDGSRVTYLVINESEDGSGMSVKLIGEEPKEIVDKEIALEKAKQAPESFPAEASSSRVLALAQSNVGRRVGSGDCSALRGSGPALGTIGGGGSGIQNLMPGQVLRLSPGSGFSGSMGYFSASSSGHYIVVESVQPNGQITFLDQNWMGGSSSGQTVRRASGNLRTLNGSATIYSGQ